jgi:hypothetical protein
LASSSKKREEGLVMTGLYRDGCWNGLRNALGRALAKDAQALRS